MPGPRKLWTAPCGESTIGRAIARASPETSTLWLVPSRLAKNQVTQALAARSTGVEVPRVWCWEDVWASIARAQPDVPARLSASGLRLSNSKKVGRGREVGVPPRSEWSA